MRARRRLLRPSCLWLPLALLPVAAAHGSARAAAARMVHTVLASASPAPDATVRAPVRELRLVFSTAVQPALSTITLIGPVGVPIEGPAQPATGDGDAELVLALGAPLPSGSYTVEWHTAGPDGHPIEGSYGFLVELPEPEAAAPPANGDSTRAPEGAADAEPAGPGALAALVRWLLDATVVGTIGLAVFRWLVLERLRADPSYALLAFPAMRRLWGVGLGIAALALALLPVRLGLQAIELFGPDAARRSGALLASAWGASWWLQGAAAVLLAAGLLLGGAQGRRAGWALVALAAPLMALALPLSGHAVAQEPRALVVLNDAVHVGAAGSWFGGLLLVLAVGMPAVREADVPAQLGGGGAALARVVGAFSRVAVAAAALLLFTGIVNARVIVGSWEALFASRYGQTLLWKLGLIVPAALLGLYHWQVVRPELAAGAGAGRLRPTALAELALALLVLGITAVLALTPH